jgi:class 3 adenylate cyclase
MPTIPFSHIQMEWQDSLWRGWYEQLSGSDIRLLRYDSRGCGLSWSDSTDYSLDAMVDDLAAVVDRAGLKAFGLVAPVQAGPAALTFAARHPERVSRIVLWCAASRGDELRTSSFEALRVMSHSDWSLFSEAAAHALLAGWDNGQAAHKMAAIVRESASAAIHESVLTNYLESDISSLLADIRCPVLVAYRSEGTSPLPSSARYLASAIPGANLMAFPGSSLLFVLDDASEIAAEFRLFLLADAGPARTSENSVQTLLYTDVEGHTAMMQRLGDADGREVLRHHERITRSAIERHRGTEALTTGDGFVVRFSDALDALACASDLQRDLAEASVDLPVELRVRIGINVGQPIIEGDQVHGAVVFAARRIAAHANGGEVLVSDAVRELATDNRFAFHNRGEFELLGQPAPVRLWELLWAHAAT